MAGPKAGFTRQDINKLIWEVPNNYEQLVALAIDAFGNVCSAHDKQNGREVAIKKASFPFQSITHAKRTYKELRLLRHMKHENVNSLLDVFTPNTTLENFTDVYLVTELVGADLNNIMKVQTLTDDHIQFIVYQILRALKYVHSMGIIHKDLKPSNIGVNENCELKILNTGITGDSDNTMTGHLATHWYKAPEIVLNWMEFNQKVDIWSVGCIMAELITHNTLFPGNDHIDQLTKIMQLTGKPEGEFLNKITNEQARIYIESMPNYKKQDLSTVFPSATPKARALLDRMLVMDPDMRITAVDALAHPYLAAYSEPTDEPVSQPFDLSFENQELPLNKWKELVYDEIRTFVPPPAVE